MAEINYSTIDRPYDSQMQRSGETLSVGESSSSSQDASSSTYSSANTPSASIKKSVATGVNGSVEIQPVKTDGSMGDVWITNFIRSQNWKPKTVGFYIDGQTGYAEFTNVYVSGNIQALTGSIGGFKIGSDYIEDVGDSFGFSSTVTGGNDVRLWAGATFANRDTAPFRVYEDGSIAGTGLTITKIDLPDSTSTNSFHVDTAGNTWWGANIATGYAGAPASVLNTGVVSFVSGTIGGNILGATSIGSPGFVSGPIGTGWNISSTGTAEFQNVTIRGTIRTSVFEKDTISAINGMVLVSKADILSNDMTALDSSTLTISGQTSFSVNEVIRIKDGTNDEWMLVTDVVSAPVYTVTRDTASSYSINNNPAWKKGTAVVSMGIGSGSKTGYISFDSSSSNSPFIDIYGRNSNTYTDVTLHARIGWLKGITDSSIGLNNTDVWGIYSDNVYLKGSIVANTGFIGGSTGWVISSNYIKDNAGVTGLSSVVTSGNDIRFWAGNNTPSLAPFRVYEDGSVYASNLTLSGYLQVGQAASDTTTSIGSSGLSYLSSNLGSITAGTIVLPSSGHIRSGQTNFNSGTGFFLGNVSSVPKFSIGDPSGYRLTWDGTALVIVSDSIIDTSFQMLGDSETLYSNCVFTSGINSSNEIFAIHSEGTNSPTPPYSTSIRLIKLQKTGGVYAHITTVTTSAINDGATNPFCGITLLGSYLYYGYVEYGTGDVYIHRYTTDLSTRVIMTVSGALPSNGGDSGSGFAIFSDGTYLYCHKRGGGTDVYKYSVSGTTLTNIATINFAFMSAQGSYWSDGTYVYCYSSYSGGGKWAITGGSRLSLSTVSTNFGPQNLVGKNGSTAVAISSFYYSPQLFYHVVYDYTSSQNTYKIRIISK